VKTVVVQTLRGIPCLLCHTKAGDFGFACPLSAGRVCEKLCSGYLLQHPVLRFLPAPGLHQTALLAVKTAWRSAPERQAVQTRWKAAAGPCLYLLAGQEDLAPAPLAHRLRRSLARLLQHIHAACIPAQAS